MVLCQAERSEPGQGQGPDCGRGGYRAVSSLPGQVSRQIRESGLGARWHDAARFRGPDFVLWGPLRPENKSYAAQ